MISARWGSEDHLDAIILGSTEVDPTILILALEQASVYLVMGIEEYLRAVDAAMWVRTLTHVGREHKQATPTSMTLFARVIASVLEHVPGSTRIGRPIAFETVGFVTGVLKKAQELCQQNAIDLAVLAEECLRILLWAVNDDESGAIVAKTNFVRCAMNCLEWADSRVTKQIFLVVCSASRKVVFAPSVVTKAGKGSAQAAGT